MNLSVRSSLTQYFALRGSNKNGTSPCKRCRLSEPLCICSAIQKVNTAFEIIIIRHPSESNRASNSARLAEMCIPQAQIYVAKEGAFPNHSGDDWLLFPHYDDAPIANPACTPKRLYVLDGTWRQVRRLRTRLDLCSLKHFQPLPLPVPPPRIRHPSFP